MGAALLILAAAGCERTVVINDYFPLRDGNRWEYRLLDQARLKALAEGKRIETAPNVSGAPTEPEASGAERKAEVVGLEAGTPTPKGPGKSGPAAPARRVALVLKEPKDPLTFRATYGRYEQVWSKRGGYVGFQNAAGRSYLLILPPHTGYRWVVTSKDGENLYYEIEGQKDVTTPAGLFRACAVARQETRDKRIAFRYWFAPGVGLVRRSKYYLGEEVFRQELVAYKARPAKQESRKAEDREIKRALAGKRRGREHFKNKPRRFPPPLASP